ncbi:hypothetical protein BG006_010569 [Podila minutissima]|uniref:Uncharacterized protein n=1 Tax=Podila minutissima TaxID=64525 RepID=A0A9P5SD11_9FUNG|nr:hypothetical protein BG006_010569 [Podila minutissima]
MHRSTLFLTLAAIALGAPARLNSNSQASSGNILSPPSIAARGLDNIDTHLFERNFIEATLERRQMPDLPQVGQVAQLADTTKLADVTKFAGVPQTEGASQVADVSKLADATKLNRREVIEVKLRRRNVDDHARTHAGLLRRRRNLENIVSDTHKMINVKLSKRADIKGTFENFKTKVNDLVKLDRRSMDVNDVTHKLIGVKLFGRHEEAVNAHAIAKRDLQRHQDLVNIVSDASRVSSDKLRKRADISDDLDSLRAKVNDLMADSLVSGMAIPQSIDAGRAVQKRKRTIEGTRIIPRNSEDYDDDFYDDDSEFLAESGEFETQDKKENKSALAPAAADTKTHSGASSISKNAGLSLVGVAISSLFLLV